MAWRRCFVFWHQRCLHTELWHLQKTMKQKTFVSKVFFLCDLANPPVCMMTHNCVHPFRTGARIYSCLLLRWKMTRSNVYMCDTATGNQIRKKWILILRKDSLIGSNNNCILPTTWNRPGTYRRDGIWSIEWILMGNTGVWFVIFLRGLKGFCSGSFKIDAKKNITKNWCWLLGGFVSWSGREICRPSELKVLSNWMVCGTNNILDIYSVHVSLYTVCMSWSYIM
jgi:hypothetical protein